MPVRIDRLPATSRPGAGRGEHFPITDRRSSEAAAPDYAVEAVKAILRDSRLRASSGAGPSASTPTASATTSRSVAARMAGRATRRSVSCGTFSPTSSEVSGALPTASRCPSRHRSELPRVRLRVVEGLRHEGLSRDTLDDYNGSCLPPVAVLRQASAVGDHDRRRSTATGARRCARGLSATSINKTITRLAQILEVAVERELIDRNPARAEATAVEGRAPSAAGSIAPTRSMRCSTPRASWTAEAADREMLRRLLLATLILAGLRLGEALDLRWRDVDLAAGRLRVIDSKTDAGVREVDLLPLLREELATYKAGCRNASGSALVFATGTGGTPKNPSNVRNRMLAGSVKLANEHREKAGLGPLPDRLTPHSLRRTFISLLLAEGEDPPYVMRQVGHSDPKATLGIYAQVMLRKDDGERQRLRALVCGTGDIPKPEPDSTRQLTI